MSKLQKVINKTPYALPIPTAPGKQVLLSPGGSATVEAQYVKHWVKGSSVTHWVKCKIIVIEDVEGEKVIEANKPKTTAEVADAVQLIGQIEDLDDLETMLAEESHEDIRTAIQRRMATLIG